MRFEDQLFIFWAFIMPLAVLSLGVFIAALWAIKPPIYLLPHKEIGWTELGEVFYRFTLVKSRWGNLYLHRLFAPNAHPHCHDHPWDFWTFLLWGGYFEFHDGTWTWRAPGSLLYRPAEWKHNVITVGVS